MTEKIIEQLEKNREVFTGLLSGKSSEARTWRPEPGKWNLTEIVCHLLDEERYDFRARVRHTLENRSVPPEPIDPEGWVTARNYAAQDYNPTLEAFLEERSKSVAWLKSLQNPDWENTYHHNTFGPMSARLFLTNWLAHDYLHIRQITRYHYQYLKEKTTIELRYAGTW